jgi:hypothetical protein
VLVIDGGRVLEERAAVSAGELGRLVIDLRTRHGAGARILVDGAELDPQALARIAAEAAPQVVPTRPPTRVLATEAGTIAGVELAHAMLWDTYDRATRVQAWMLEQASAFTVELLENNKRLADQASELQKRFQSSLAEIDFLAREKMMMDAEASASRYSRHLVEKARAEAEAARPSRSAGEWVADLVDGVALALGVMCGARAPKDPWNSN